MDEVLNKNNCKIYLLE